MTTKTSSVLIISEGGAGFPVPSTSQDTESHTSRRLHLDSAFLNVITSLLIAKFHIHAGNRVRIRFGVQYFTSANEYHIPESFEEEFYRDPSRCQIGGDIQEYLDGFDIQNEDQRHRIATYLELFRRYINRAPIIYSTNSPEFNIPDMFNMMGKLQRAVKIVHNPITNDDQSLLGRSPNEITKILILKIAEILELKGKIEIIFDEGPRLLIDPKWLIDITPENLKEFRDRYRKEIFGHVFKFLKELGYNPPDSLPATIPSENGEQYNGIRYLFNDKNWLKAVRTYMGNGLGNFGSRRVDREELIERINKAREIHLKFPLAVFEGEMIVPVNTIQQLTDPSMFDDWVERNREEVKKYDMVYVVEGIEGFEENPHTIGLRAKIIEHFAEEKFVRVKSPSDAKSLEVNYELEEIVRRVEEMHGTLVRYLKT
ncbi:MAG: hypothetical protein N3C61_00565 [Candidatus Micrarchaeota archaeon]|nr:hypothetical protein [Candidatus Micrarchaeota archaeon]